MRSAFSKAA